MRAGRPRTNRRPPPASESVTVVRLVVALTATLVVAVVTGLAWARGDAPGDPRLVRVGEFVSPVYVASPPGDRRRFFVVEQPGRIMVVRDGTPLAAPFLDIRGLVAFGGERGLLSMAFPPDYATSGRFYVYYTARSPTGALTIAEYRAASSGDTAMPPVQRILISIPHPRGNHNGGQLQSGPTAPLDRNRRWRRTGDPDGNGQRLDTLLGKLLRIDRMAPARRRTPSRSTTPSPARAAAAGRSGRTASATRGASRSTARRGPRDRRRRTERLGGDRLRAGAGARPRRELRLGLWEGRHAYWATTTSPSAVRCRASSRRCTSTRTPADAR